MRTKELVRKAQVVKHRYNLRPRPNLPQVKYASNQQKKRRIPKNSKDCRETECTTPSNSIEKTIQQPSCNKYQNTVFKEQEKLLCGHAFDSDFLSYHLKKAYYCPSCGKIQMRYERKKLEAELRLHQLSREERHQKRLAFYVQQQQELLLEQMCYTERRQRLTMHTMLMMTLRKRLWLITKYQPLMKEQLELMEELQELLEYQENPQPRQFLQEDIHRKIIKDHLQLMKNDLRDVRLQSQQLPDEEFPFVDKKLQSLQKQLQCFERKLEYLDHNTWLQRERFRRENFGYNFAGRRSLFL